MGTSSSGSDHAAPGSPSLARRLVVATQRRRWQQHAGSWERHAVDGLESVIDTVVARSGPPPHGVVVDVGSGGGAVALRLAPQADRVVAVDVSEAMLDKLQERAAVSGMDHVEARCEPIEDLDLPPASVDLVVSNYALHHLLDRDKQQFVTKAAEWLRPGGRLVIGDMMIGRGLEPEDRRILASKARVLIARGPGGWWRVVKNAWRLYSRSVERPLPVKSWTDMLDQAGFEGVDAERVVAEAAVVTGTRS